MEVKNKRSLLIVGGGIGGLAVAIRASQEGMNVTVLEQAQEFTEVGAGIQLGPNALAVLDKLGVYSNLKKLSVFPKRIVIKDAISAETLTILDLGPAFIQQFGYPYIVAHRSDLLNELLKACQQQSNITLMTKKKVVSIDSDEEGASVICQDGTSYHADVVIGADGIKSNVRKYIIDDEPVSDHFVAYRGTVPVEKVADFINLDELYLWIGPDLHFVQYPVRATELLNQVAVFKSKKYQADSDNWGTVAELEEAYAPCCEQIKRGLSYINKDMRWAMYDREPISTWTKNRVTLLGDAAHPMYQYLAQGACQALEDADRIIENVVNQPNDIDLALSQYEAERTERTSKVQRGARLFGNMKHASDPATLILRNKVFRDRKYDDYSAVDWIYGHAIKYQSKIRNS